MMSIVIAAPPFSSSGTDTLRLRIVAPQEGAKFCRSKTGERPHQRDPRQGGLANVRHSVIILGGTVEAFIEMVSTTRRSARPTATLPVMLKLASGDLRRLTSLARRGR
jgi:hypothetical protein